jgi:hypothetical protein
MGTTIAALDCRSKKEGRGREEAGAVGTTVFHCGRGKEGGEASGRRKTA